ncbi:MAG: phage tail tape measure C-terminal domain-containing protein [Pseudomonadota bacterium]
MEEFELSLERASQTLTQFADRTAVEAASNLEQAFARAGGTIEQALNQAAQSGELNFRRMTEAILTDLARVAAEAVIAQSGIGQAGQVVNFSLNGAAPGLSAVTGGSALESLVAAAAARGARYA